MLIILIISILAYGFILNKFLGNNSIDSSLSVILFIVLSFSFHGVMFIVTTVLGIPWIACLALLFIVGVYLVLKNRHYLKTLLLSRPRVSNSAVTMSFILLYGLYVFKIFSYKYGGWDAFAIWNSHARFLADSNSWGNMLHPALSWSHNEYPLLFPSFSSMFWRLSGNDNPLIPILVSLGVFFALILTLYKSISGKFANIISIISCIVLVTNTDFIIKISSQYADSTLALFYLITLLLLSRTIKSNRNSYILLGAFAALNCWIKNEGLIFFVLLSIGFFIYNLNALKNVLYYCYGAVPLFTGHMVYKMSIAPKGDLERHPYNEFWQNIQDPSRYQVIFNKFESLINFEFSVIPICLFIAIILTGKKIFKELSLIIVLITLFAYCAFFVITPLDLSWHLETALDRLILQLYPSIIMITAIIVNTYIERKYS